MLPRLICYRGPITVHTLTLYLIGCSLSIEMVYCSVVHWFTLLPLPSGLKSFCIVYYLPFHNIKTHSHYIFIVWRLLHSFTTFWIKHFTVTVNAYNANTAGSINSFIAHAEKKLGRVYRSGSAQRCLLSWPWEACGVGAIRSHHYSKSIKLSNDCQNIKFSLFEVTLTFDSQMVTRWQSG